MHGAAGLLGVRPRAVSDPRGTVLAFTRGMAASIPSSLFDRLRQRVDTLPLDRAPLRRAGLLTVLLIVLLVLGRAFGSAPARSADRQDVRSATEEVSAPASSPTWTGGRVLAILFLVTGGGLAFWLHRRSSGRTTAIGSTLRVLETHTLGPGQSLRLVACGDEVLLLSVASEGATLLRHWPRDTFEAAPVSFADALATLSSTPPAPHATPRTDLLLSTDERQGEGAHILELATPVSLQQDGEANARASSPDAAPDEEHLGLHEQDDMSEESLPAPAVPEPGPALARGTLFPIRTHAPHQFDVRHG